MPVEPLQRLDEDLWVASRPLPLWVGDVGTRMSVIRLSGGELILHSPVSLDPALREAIDGIGTVRWVVGPNKVHHLFIGDWPARSLRDLCLPPGWPRESDLAPRVLAAARAAVRALLHHVFAGAPRLTGSLPAPPRPHSPADRPGLHVGPGNRARLLHWLLGATDRFGPHRLVRTMIRDREAARASLATILAWDFDRVIVTHGEVLEHGGREALRAGFAYLG